MTIPATSQGTAVPGLSAQQGYGAGFPAPLGIEQYLGQSQQYGGFPQGFPQQYSGLAQSYGQPQFPWQQAPAMQQGPVQQVVASTVTQLLPIAHQLILPQVLATAMQQIQVHLQQLVGQQAAWQAGQQQPQFGSIGWQQPQFAQPGQFPFGRYQAGF
jgi:hypothetical protein